MSPIYDFRCPECGVEIRKKLSMDDRNNFPTCDHCEKEMKRVITPTTHIYKCAATYANIRGDGHEHG